MHFLDLPLLTKQPSIEELNEALNQLESESSTNFEEPEHLDKNTRQWLSRLAIHELSWISEDLEDEKEQIRSKASRRLSYECGVSASGSRVRKVELNNGLVFLLNEPGVTEDQLGKLTWGASLVMARRIADHKTYFANKQVLELGSGTGLCGLAAAWAGAQVELTDLPEIVENLGHNLELNKLMGSVYPFDWANPPSNFTMPEIILVSDPLYSSEHPKLLFTALEKVKCQEVWLELPLRQKFQTERENLYELMNKVYTRVEYAEEEGRDLFGEQSYAFTRWKRGTSDQ